jgi:uncharacterized protein (DUF169 family)
MQQFCFGDREPAKQLDRIRGHLDHARLIWGDQLVKQIVAQRCKPVRAALGVSDAPEHVKLESVLSCAQTFNRPVFVTLLVDPLDVDIVNHIEVLLHPLHHSDERWVGFLEYSVKFFSGHGTLSKTKQNETEGNGD